MFSLCRLCAVEKDPEKLKTPISDLEEKLILCCGWIPSKNESQMPIKACEECVEQLHRSWCFAESVKAAETKLNQLIIEQIKAEADSDNAFLINEVMIPVSIKLEPELYLMESEEFIHIEDERLNDDDIKCSDAESSNSNGKTFKTRRDQFLAYLNDDDRFADGTITTNGIYKLEKVFPEMKSISWLKCVFKCYKCNRKFEGLNNFHAHNRSIHKEQVGKMILKCFYCKSEHRREYTLCQHMAMEHFPHLKYCCWYCTDYFWDSSALVEHRNSHTNIEYKCELCTDIEYKCTNRDRFDRHVAQSHQNKRWATDPQIKFTCDICLKDFPTKWGIINHMVMHSKKFDFICEQCGRKFPSKGNLKTHSRTHSTDPPSQIKPFSCSQCDSRFRTKQQLVKHSRVHVQFKEFKCTVCEKRFRLKNGLTEHMKRHNDILPYACKYCQRKFRSSSNLRTHVRTHTNEKPYKCTFEQCQYRSANKSNLNKHSRVHCKLNPPMSI